MKIASVIAASALLGGCSHLHLGSSISQTIGSGKSKTESRSPGEFKNIDFSGSGELVFVKGKVCHVEITTDDNILKQVKTRVKNGTLQVGSEGSYSTKIGLKVLVTAPTLTGVQLSGSGQIKVNEINREQFVARLSGSGEITLLGSARSAGLELSGSGNINAKGLKTEVGTAQITGSGSIHVNASKDLIATITGSGTIYYMGNPSLISNLTGSGNVVQEPR